MRLLRYILVAFSTLLAAATLAQGSADTASRYTGVLPVQRSDTLSVIAVSDSGYVRLQWYAPSVPRMFAVAEGGFKVERRAVETDDWEELAQSPIRASSAATQASSTDAMLDVYAEAVARAGIVNTLSDNDLARADRSREANGIALMAMLRSEAVARKAGYFLIDSLVEFGRYEYRVTPLVGAALALPRTVSVDARVHEALQPTSPITVRWRDREVELEWAGDAAERYAYYHVERRVAEETSWTQLTDAPLMVSRTDAMRFRDSLADNTTIYSYRIVATDYVHRVGPPSLTISGHGLSLAPMPGVFIDSVEGTASGGVALRWKMQASVGVAEVVAQQVYRSARPDGPYAPVSETLASAARTYTDEGVELDRAYYRVYAYDSLGREAQSGLQMYIAVDSIPPAAPVGLAAEVSAEGVVELTWAKNEEEDLAGYRVFYGVTREEQGGRLTDSLEVLPQRFDSLYLTSLGDSVYYRVVALDFRQNISSFSATLGVALPDVHPPLPTTLVNAVGDTSGVLLTYIPSSSADATDYYWQRRAVGTENWYAFAKTPAPAALLPNVEPLRMRDSTGGTTYRYEYRLEVRDDAGLASWSNLVSGQQTWNKILPAVEDLQARIDDEDRSVLLQWSYPEDAVLQRFRIYRAFGDNSLTTYRTLTLDQLAKKPASSSNQPTQWRLKDDDVLLGGDYRYAVVAEGRGGSRGRMGEEVEATD